MTKKELVELLNKYPDDATVECWNTDNWGDTSPIDTCDIQYDEEHNKIIL